MGDPARMGELLRLNGPDRVRIDAINAAVHRFAVERRARVLRYPDLAALLCMPPLSLAAPERWGGYVPPRTGQEQLPEILHSGAAFGNVGRPNGAAKSTGPTDLNISDHRDALVAICREAFTRDVAAGLAPVNEWDVVGPLIDDFRSARSRQNVKPWADGPPGPPAPVQAELPDPDPGPGGTAAPDAWEVRTMAPEPEGWPDGSMGEQVNR